MADLHSDLPLLTDEQRVQIESSFSLIVLKVLASEIAAINRSPREANDYLVNLKEKIQRIIASIQTEETTFSKQWGREMHLLTEEMFQGIAFKAVKK